MSGTGSWMDTPASGMDADGHTSWYHRGVNGHAVIAGSLVALSLLLFSSGEGRFAELLLGLYFTSAITLMPVIFLTRARRDCPT